MPLTGIVNDWGSLMPQLVRLGAILSCSFGTAPTPMVVPYRKPVVPNALPIATIMDFLPIDNIPSFVGCTSPANPASGGGVLSPAPCIPATTSPWFPGYPRIQIDGIPALSPGSTCQCNWQGEIKIDEPGQETASTDA